jgi:hypothetical protein
MMRRRNVRDHPPRYRPVTGWRREEFHASRRLYRDAIPAKLWEAGLRSPCTEKKNRANAMRGESMSG